MNRGQLFFRPRSRRSVTPHTLVTLQAPYTLHTHRSGPPAGRPRLIPLFLRPICGHFHVCFHGLRHVVPPRRTGSGYSFPRFPPPEAAPSPCTRTRHATPRTFPTPPPLSSLSPPFRPKSSPSPPDIREQPPRHPRPEIESLTQRIMFLPPAHDTTKNRSRCKSKTLQK